MLSLMKQNTPVVLLLKFLFGKSGVHYVGPIKLIFIAGQIAFDELSPFLNIFFSPVTI